MIGLDTNVLVRALLDEQDEEHTRLARSLIGACADAGEQIHVNLVVLVEAVWILRRFGKIDREGIATFVDMLLLTSNVVLVERDAIAEAVDTFRRGPADFADALIGVLNKRAGCTTTYTFDRGAARLETFTTVAAA